MRGIYNRRLALRATVIAREFPISAQDVYEVLVRWRGLGPPVYPPAWRWRQVFRLSLRSNLSLGEVWSLIDGQWQL